MKGQVTPRVEGLVSTTLKYFHIGHIALLGMQQYSPSSYCTSWYSVPFVPENSSAKFSRLYLSSNRNIISSPSARTWQCLPWQYSFRHLTTVSAPAGPDLRVEPLTAVIPSGAFLGSSFSLACCSPCAMLSCVVEFKMSSRSTSS
jgi:hypothetical protein